MRVIQSIHSVNSIHFNLQLTNSMKSEKCFGYKNSVYPIEKVSINGTSYHKSCFKRSHGGCVISPFNYIAHEGRLYCKHHHIQLIKEKGNLRKLEGDHEMNPAMTTEVTAES
ncbi:LIM domain-containing protein WLIM1 [Capsicum annuum]|nr:LIM domain-containing protein WLIM1 [Capsicum annuum]KAF3650760.1 LIM domain-containing protein WLIM1 [Capsicum annuum]